MKKFKDNQYENSTNLGSANVVAKDSNINAELCTEALITLQNMFVNASRSMEQSFYKVWLKKMSMEYNFRIINNRIRIFFIPFYFISIREEGSFFIIYFRR